MILIIKNAMKKALKRIRTHSNSVDSSPTNYIEELRNAGMIIGENVDILNSRLDPNHRALITIGSNVTITNATLLAHDASTKKELGFTKAGNIVIGDNVFIGLGAIILPNTRIGNRVIVGAGTVVARDIPDNSVVIGNPAKIVCSYEEYMHNNNNNMQNSPVYSSAICDYSLERQMIIKDELTGIIGYEL